MRLVWPMEVTNVLEKQVTVAGKLSPDGERELLVESAGWYLVLGNVSLYCGDIKPPFEKGDMIYLMVQKQENDSANPKAEGHVGS